MDRNIFETTEAELDKDFYANLEQLKQEGNAEKTERFLLETFETVKDIGTIAGVSGTCGACVSDEDAAAAEKQLMEALAKRSASVVPVLNELATFYVEQERYDEGIATFEDVLNEVEICLLSGSQTHAVILVNLAGALKLSGQDDRANEVLNSAREIVMNQ